MARLENLLASDAERSMVAARLQDAATEGRLTLDEFSRRASRAYAARTWAELDRLLIDLPTPRAVGSATPRTLDSLRALPCVALGIGIVSLYAGLMWSWGVLVGLAGVVFGVFALCRAGRLSSANRRLCIAGIVCSLVTPTFFIILHLLIDALPG